MLVAPVKTFERRQVRSFERKAVGIYLFKGQVFCRQTRTKALEARFLYGHTGKLACFMHLGAKDCLTGGH